MGTYRTTPIYSKAFADFLACTNEKEVLRDAIETVLNEEQVQSVLDIGAGNGDLALPLAKLVPQYVAVEQKPDYVSLLRKHGIETIGQAFPCAVRGKFDMVVSSHSLPWEPSKYIPFISAAWSHVESGGILLIITYDDSAQSVWVRLLEACKLHVPDSTDRIPDLTSWLEKSFGNVRTRITTTHVASPSFDEISRALAFVYSDGSLEMTNEFLDEGDLVQEYLDTHHRIGATYRFPFQHSLLVVQNADFR